MIKWSILSCLSSFQNELRRLAAEEELRQQQIQSFIEHTRANSVLHAMFDRFGSDG